MAVSSLHRFRTLPGKAAAHLESTAEATELLRGLGLQAASLQAIAGGDIGTITTTIMHESNAAWAATVQRLQTDPGWMDFVGRVMADPPAEQVESSLFVDLDPTFQPDPDRPLGVIAATQWRAFPGKMASFIGHVTTASDHIARLGGSARVMQSLVGEHPLSAIVAIGHADLDAYGEFADKQAADEQFQAFWMEVSANPSADLLRSGIYVNLG